MIICSDCFKRCADKEYVKRNVTVLFDETCDVCCGAEEICFQLDTGDIVGEKVLEDALQKD